MPLRRRCSVVQATALGRRVAPHLAGDRRRCSLQPASNMTYASSLGAQKSNLLTFLERQITVIDQNPCVATHADGDLAARSGTTSSRPEVVPGILAAHQRERSGRNQRTSSSRRAPGDLADGAMLSGIASSANRPDRRSAPHRAPGSTQKENLDDIAPPWRSVLAPGHDFSVARGPFAGRIASPRGQRRIRVAGRSRRRAPRLAHRSIELILLADERHLATGGPRPASGASPGSSPSRRGRASRPARFRVVARPAEIPSRAPSTRARATVVRRARWRSLQEPPRQVARRRSALDAHRPPGPGRPQQPAGFSLEHGGLVIGELRIGCARCLPSIDQPGPSPRVRAAPSRE